MSSDVPKVTRPVGVHYEGDLGPALVEAAAALVDEVGTERLSLREVARRLGVSHAAPAHHFGDKSGLLTAVAAAGFREFADRLAAVAAGCGDDPFERLAALGRAYAEYAADRPGVFDLMFQPAATRRDDAELLAAGLAAFSALRREVARCQEAGWHQRADTQALAVAAWSLAHGLSVLRRQGTLTPLFPDSSLDGVAAVLATLVDRPGPSTN